MTMITATITASQARDPRVVTMMMTIIMASQARVPRVVNLMDMMMDTVEATADTQATVAPVTVAVVMTMIMVTITASQAKDPMAARARREDIMMASQAREARVDIMIMMMDTVDIQKSMNMPHVMMGMGMDDGHK
jgi:hypothetical protein